MFNSNTLGYKLVNDKLKKHSEQLNKYVAGLMDADGYITFEYHDNNKTYTRIGLSQAATVDADFQMLRALQRHYKLGKINYTYQSCNEVSIAHWRLSTREAKILYNRIGKHMRLKQTHFENILSLETSKYTREELKEIIKKSREDSGWKKKPKHLSYAYVAGLIDGDGCYRFRKKPRKSLCVKVALHEDFILDKLQEDFRGSINNHSQGMRCWRRGLGIGHIKFSLPFLKKMRNYSCIEGKYLKIDEMIRYLQAAETKRLEVEKTK